MRIRLLEEELEIKSKLLVKAQQEIQTQDRDIEVIKEENHTRIEILE